MRLSYQETVVCMHLSCRSHPPAIDIEVTARREVSHKPRMDSFWLLLSNTANLVLILTEVRMTCGYDFVPITSR